MRGVAGSFFTGIGLFMLFSSPAFAGSRDIPDYTYLQVNYVYAVSKADSSATGIAGGVRVTREGTYETDIPGGGGFKANWLFADAVLVRISGYGGTGEWRDKVDVDTQSVIGGVSYLFTTENGTGIDAGIDYRRDNIEFDSSGTYTYFDAGKSDNTIHGPGVSLGIRKIFLGRHEFGARVGYYEGDFEGTASVLLSYAWNFSYKWSLALFWEQIDATVELEEVSEYKLDQYGIGARYAF